MVAEIRRPENRRPRRILGITSLYPPFHGGGYGVLSHTVLDGLSRRGHAVAVLCTDGGVKGRADGDFAHHAQVWRDLDFARYGSAARLLRQRSRNLRAVREAIRRHRPEYIYYHCGDGLGLDAYNAAISTGVPTAVLIGDAWLADLVRDPGYLDPWTAVWRRRPEPLPRRAMRMGLRAVASLTGGASLEHVRSAERYHAISTHLLEQLVHHGVPRERCALLPSPLPAEYFEATPAVPKPSDSGSTLRALFVGRMQLEKGPDVAIRAVAEARRTGTDVALTLCGLRRGLAEAELRALIAELGVAPHVRWAEAADTPSLIELYRRHDLLLFPSRLVEGFGLVNAEAMACGLPVIGVPTGGAADIILHERTGLAVPVGDHGAMAAAITRIFREPGLASGLSEGARVHAQRHRPDSVLSFVEMEIDHLCRPTVVALRG